MDPVVCPAGIIIWGKSLISLTLWLDSSEIYIEEDPTATANGSLNLAVSKDPSTWP